LASLIGGPLSGVVLGMNGTAGLAGWQWLFILEGLPATILGLASFSFLAESPLRAVWLSDEEKRRVAARVAAEDVAEHRAVGPALRDPRLIALSLVNLALLFAITGTTLWLPQIVQGMGYSNLGTGLITALPYAVSIPAMFLWGRSSDLHDERVKHVALPAMMAAAGFLAASILPSNVLSLVAITVAMVGLLTMQPPYFGLVSTFLSGPAVAGGTALVISISNLGSFLGPTLVGVLKERTGGYAASMLMFCVVMILAAFIVLMVGRAMAAPTPVKAPALA